MKTIFLRFFVHIKGIQIKFYNHMLFAENYRKKNGKILYLKHHLLNGGFPSVKDIQLC